MDNQTLPAVPPDARWMQIEARLAALAVLPALRGDLRRAVTGSFDGLLLYGSWARGDAHAESDLDTLALNYKGKTPTADGQVSVAVYSASDLKSASGTLFGYHLARDGQILSDPSGLLAHLLAHIKPPRLGSVVERIRSLTPVLDVTPSDLGMYLEGLTQIARYLLRSALYAEALDVGRPCFSVREIADRMNDPALAILLSSHRSVRPPASEDVFEDLRNRLTTQLGALKINPFGSLHGLIIGAWITDQDLSNLGTLALSGGDDDLPYDQLPKVIL